MELIIQKSKLAMENILNADDYSEHSSNVETGFNVVYYGSLPPPYSSAKIDLTRLLSPVEMNNKIKINDKIKEIIEWNLNRINQVEAEMKALAQSSNFLQ